MDSLPIENSEADQSDVVAFQEAFADTDFHLLEPVNPDVNYSFEVMLADAYTLELRADKWWFGPDGEVEGTGLTLNTYALEDNEVQRVTAHEEAMLEREDLLRTHAKEGLEGAMQLAEEMAVANGYLDADRDDPRLFTEGPQDAFLSQREQAELAAQQLTGPSLDLEDTTPGYESAPGLTLDF